MIHSKNKIKNLFFCESRPNFEGRILANRMSEKGINTEIILEALVPEYTDKSDICIIGADTILYDNSVINKIGSRALAQSSYFSAIPFVVLTDTSKYINSQYYKLHEEEKPSDEIWKGKPEKIKCINKYFEVVENALITEIITDKTRLPI